MKRTNFSKIKAIPMILILMGLFFSMPSMAQRKKGKTPPPPKNEIKSSTVSGLKFREIGPSFTSGRIADFAVNPANHSEYYVAVASGHVWKTINNGTTFKPVFDKQKSYSIGVVTMDPNNSNVVWVGTGENNHQRVLGYGDGVYKSLDGGKSWKNMGLKESRQIGGIVVDPNNSDVVFVAAEGSVWGPGGDRGLYKTIDGGQNWKKVLEISEHTGVNNIIMDPRDSKVMYATSEQRRRHVHTKIGGGPESAMYKSTDGGENWRKLKSGLPGGDIGGMGIAISPVNPDVIYAIIEAAGKSGGFFRSTNRGESWSKMSSYASSGQYYNEIVCDPVDVDKVYSTETRTRVTLDAGKTWKSLSNNGRHVDDHAMWIDPNDTNHFMIGGDGGVYETFDNGGTWIFKSNLPVTQFYRVATDNTYPFYWVYGGTQDNNSFGGPTQNTSREGVTQDEWIVTQGGDGFWQAIEPSNPDIVYSAWQYGNVVRYDKKSGESISIKPSPKAGEETYKWNWDAPYFISPHSETRLYMTANKVFRSDDRGNTWKVISDDITSQTDRNTWPAMDQYWSIDAVVKDVSTSLFGMGVSLAESRVQEDLIYVGTDDGVISVSEQNGDEWFQVKKFPGVPEYTYVSDIMPSKFDANVVFATFNNMKRDDFKPYVLKSSDKGRTWKSIANNLPEDETVHTIEQDFVNPELIFVGTEFSFYFSTNGGENWIKLASGLPSIPVKDIAIQERENDLVLATFGRGFYVMDDFTPLRELNEELIKKDAHIFPVKDALMYVQTSNKNAELGSTVYVASNPAYGATFTYYLKDIPKTLKQTRTAAEKKLFKEKKPIPQPNMDEIRAEAAEIAPYLIFTIKDQNGNVVRKLNKRPKKGVNRVNWDMTYASTRAVRLTGNKFTPVASTGRVPWWQRMGGTPVMPGNYMVSLDMIAKGKVTSLVNDVKFTTKKLNNTTLPGDPAELLAFQNEVSKLSQLSNGTQAVTNELMTRVQFVMQAVNNTPGIPNELMVKAANLAKELDNLLWKFNGQRPKASREENWPAAPAINEYLNVAAYGTFGSTAAPTQTMREQMKLAKEALKPVYNRVKTIMEVDIVSLEKELDKYGAPFTPGRLPAWIK
jgi:photosystem II stability/assembly factor-like uncharacterized protein